MLSKTVIATAALAATVAAQSAEDFPVCWASCFAEYNIQSQDCLCKDDLKDVVSSCIASGCEEADNASYEAWLASYCTTEPVSSNTWPAPSSYVPVPSSYPVPDPTPSEYPADPTPSDYPAEPTPSDYPTDPVPSDYPTDPVPSGYPEPEPSSAAPVPSYPAGTAPPYPSYSACTSTSTLIYRSTTCYSTYAVTPTYTPGAPGAPGSYPPATGTAGVYPSASGYPYDPVVPATGAGSKLVGAGLSVVGIVAGIAAVLL